MLDDKSIDIILTKNRTFLCCRPTITPDMLKKLKELLQQENSELNFQDFKSILQKIPNAKKSQFTQLFTNDEFAAMTFYESIDEKIHLFNHILPIERVLHVVDALSKITKKNTYHYTSFHPAENNTWLLELLGENGAGHPFIQLVKGLKPKKEVLIEFALSSMVKIFGEHYRSHFSPLNTETNIRTFLNECCDIQDIEIINSFTHTLSPKRTSSLTSIDLTT